MLVVLEIGEGSFENGFPITLRLETDTLVDGKPLRRIVKRFRFPAEPRIPQLYDEWQQYYYDLPRIRTIVIPAHQTPGIYLPEQDEENRRNCELAAENLENLLRQSWFLQNSFLNLKQIILNEVSSNTSNNRNEPLRAILQTDNLYLQKLPWYAWDLFDSDELLESGDELLQSGFALTRSLQPKAALANLFRLFTGLLQSEVALADQFRLFTFSAPIRILAILGNSEGIDVEADRSTLEQLAGAEVHFLIEPSREVFNRELWGQEGQHWDILYFAGHSSSNSDGSRAVFQINPRDQLSIAQLRSALKRAIKRGLKLAIFNSCDGLGLANQLRDLRIPQTVVMRAPVPDAVAQEFLKRFLQLISQGTLIYPAVRETCEWLQGHVEYHFPGASWLPVIFQNPAHQASVRLPRWQWRTLMFILGILLATLGFLTHLTPQLFPSDRTPAPTVTTPPSSSVPIPIAIGDNLSFGEETLITSRASSAKTEGNRAFLDGRYSDAISSFVRSLQQEPNDSESWVALNNAIALQNTQAISGKLEKIAAIVPAKVPSFSPEASNVAEEILRGAVIAQSEMNCESVLNLKEIVQGEYSSRNCAGRNGRFLIVVIGDDKDNLLEGQKIAEEIVESDILAVIGNNASEVTKRSLKIFQPKHLTSISPSSTALSLSKPDEDSGDKNNVYNLFLAATNDAVAAGQLSNYVKKQQQVVTAKDIVVATDFTNDNPYGISFIYEFLKELSLENQEQSILKCDLKKEFVVETCINDGKTAQWLLLIPTTPDTVNHAVRLVENGYSRWKLLGSDSAYIETMRTEFAYKGELVVAVPWGRSEFVSNFEKKASELFGVSLGAYSWRTVTGYDSAQAIIKALDDLKGNSTRIGIYARLSDTNNFAADGALGSGTVRFDEKHNREPLPDIGLGVLVKVEENHDFQLVPRNLYKDD